MIIQTMKRTFRYRRWFSHRSKRRVKMTELLVTPKSVEHIEVLIEKGADAFVIGEQKFGLRLAGEFHREAMRSGTTDSRP